MQIDVVKRELSSEDDTVSALLSRGRTAPDETDD
jgi:hypothetical protein